MSHLPVQLLGEDERRLYVYKDPGIPVFAPHADPRGDCVLARILARWPERASGWPEGFEAGVAHRLDNATRGLLVLARTPADLEVLRAEFRDGRLRKHYRFDSEGVVDFDQRLVETEIAHHARKKDRMVARRVAHFDHRGRWYPAWTRFARAERGWNAEIRTGVMHQIRVHAAYVGLPLTGDPIYGSGRGEFTLEHTGIQGPGWRFGVSGP